MRNSQAEVAAKHSLENRVYGIKAEEEPRKLEKSSSKCHLLINNLKEISSEHKTKMPLDWRSHRNSWGEGWKPSALTGQGQEIHHPKCPEHRSHMTHPIRSTCPNRSEHPLLQDGPRGKTQPESLWKKQSQFLYPEYKNCIQDVP